MTKATYTNAINAIVELYIKNDKLGASLNHLISVHNDTAAKVVYRAISRNMDKMSGMEEMLSMLSGVERDAILDEVMVKVYEYRQNLMDQE